MQTSFFRKTFIANEQNSVVRMPSEWYGAEVEIIAFPIKTQKQDVSQENKKDILNSFLRFADSHRVIENDFHFDREACYDR
jgi:hypothetical protein